MSEPLPSGRKQTSTTGFILFATVVLVTLGIFIAGHRQLDGQRADIEAGRASVALRSLSLPMRRSAGYTETALLLAEALLLTGNESSPLWRETVFALEIGSSDLRGLDSLRGVGLVSMRNRRWDRACRSFRTLAQHADDLIDQVNLAVCLTRDDAVVRDAHTASGWAFRSSRQEAVSRHLALLDQLPPAHEARALLHATLPTVLTTEWSQQQRGVDVNDTTARFHARPVLVHTVSGDTIAYDVRAERDTTGGVLLPEPAGAEAALEHDRKIGLANARAWVNEDAASLPAHVAFMRALEEAGSLDSAVPGAPSLLGELHRERLATTDRGREMVARASEVRVLVKLQRFEAARQLADSTLVRAGAVTHRELGVLGPLLALTGRALALAEAMGASAAPAGAKMPDGSVIPPAMRLQRTALVLLVYAHLGGPADSIRANQALAEEQLRIFASAALRDTMRDVLLVRSYIHAVPVMGPEIVRDLPPATPLVRAEQALGRGNNAEVARQLDALATARGTPSRVPALLDQVVLEAWLRARIGDDAGAARQLDEAFGGLTARGTTFMDRSEEAAAVGLGLKLRAEIARRMGDAAGAERWGAAARTLLASGDAGAGK